MAIVHEGVNTTDYKIKQYIEESVEASRKFHEEEVADRPREKRKDKVIIIVCAVVLLVLILCPGIVNTSKQAVKDGLDWFAEWLVDFDIFFGAEKGGILGLLMDLVRLVLYLVMRIIVGTVIHLLASIAKFLTAVLMYAIPVVVAGFCLVDLFAGDPGEFNPEAARAAAAENLPDDLEKDKAGHSAERIICDILKSKLDNSFHIFTNLYIPFDGKESETDIILVGLKGVTLIEIKYYSGIITGDLSDHDLIQKHTGRHASEKPFYNPVKQVGTHVYRTAGYLRRVCSGVNVNSCVLFVHPDGKLQLTDRTGIATKCPVFKNGDPKFLPYLMQGSGCNFTVDDYQNVLWELEKLV